MPGGKLYLAAKFRMIALQMAPHGGKLGELGSPLVGSSDVHLICIQDKPN